MINLDIAFVFQLVNFLVLVLLLNAFLYKPIRKQLAERAAQINGAKQKSAEVDREVQEKMASYEARMREIRAGAADERGTLKKEAQQQEAAILDKARSEAGASLASIKAKVAQETEDARRLLTASAETLSADICEKVLGRSL
ncbi:ATP synthase F0, B' subunit [Citrifermentans bemidjiense Bem]|uniref:ATP synthase subunit b n=1 Tax=Citrifermentans bemidjiense (strain ATCC BAA-1014 / DSM 16622 / JCM 12645 / Bem) TaxID=404380 RepID=B5EFJ2_CITBB|nr:ATP synthase F0 subunit B' [Citrifermentans bemidjiense]ACH40947.1 ATP synthase F0, B' subunit [Citrifermentans bemidjiense Bem]